MVIPSKSEVKKEAESAEAHVSAGIVVVAWDDLDQVVHRTAIRDAYTDGTVESTVLPFSRVALRHDDHVGDFAEENAMLIEDLESREQRHDRTHRERLERFVVPGETNSLCLDGRSVLTRAMERAEERAEDCLVDVTVLSWDGPHLGVEETIYIATQVGGRKASQRKPGVMNLLDFAGSTQKRVLEGLQRLRQIRTRGEHAARRSFLR